jgi:hypothetical protein
MSREERQREERRLRWGLYLDRCENQRSGTYGEWHSPVERFTGTSQSLLTIMCGFHQVMVRRIRVSGIEGEVKVEENRARIPTYDS